ncbi:MAG: hypothetical protein JWS10_3072 [Cypionkella sp.]|uniref:DUF2924 domain-containing protein n=1 Tax=Cypionkella sp. TaxID=2811411 RepID=UPI002612F03A|nr:DUF2924 domain-containing protein [Cypionkella sp.]MDB5660457.1 hypothetical protein [Cypionkella sp.]
MVTVLTVAGIAAMNRDALVQHWPGLMGSQVPKGLSQPLMRRYLAFAVQARGSGGLPKALKMRLAKNETDKIRMKAPAMRPGGRLLREWNGVTHVVDVTADGYLWQGKCHRSLSAIAQIITGAHWSGPRFFGLNAVQAKVRAMASPAKSGRRL